MFNSTVNFLFVHHLIGVNNYSRIGRRPVKKTLLYSRVLYGTPEFVKRPRGRPKGTTAAAGYRVSAGRPVGAHRDSQDQVVQTLSTPEPHHHAASISGAVRQRRKSVQCGTDISRLLRLK